jgi:hypothetical protein
LNWNSWASEVKFDTIVNELQFGHEFHYITEIVWFQWKAYVNTEKSMSEVDNMTILKQFVAAIRKILTLILKRAYILLLIFIDRLIYIVYVVHQVDILYIKFIGVAVDPPMSTLITIPAVNGLITGFCEKNRNTAMILGAVFGILPVLYYHYISLITPPNPYMPPKISIFQLYFQHICCGFLFAAIGNVWVHGAKKQEKGR